VSAADNSKPIRADGRFTNQTQLATSARYKKSNPTRRTAVLQNEPNPANRCFTKRTHLRVRFPSLAADEKTNPFCAAGFRLTTGLQNEAKCDQRAFYKSNPIQERDKSKPNTGPLAPFDKTNPFRR